MCRCVVRCCMVIVVMLIIADWLESRDHKRNKKRTILWRCGVAWVEDIAQENMSEKHNFNLWVVFRKEGRFLIYILFHKN